MKVPNAIDTIQSTEIEDNRLLFDFAANLKAIVGFGKPQNSSHLKFPALFALVSALFYIIWFIRIKRSHARNNLFSRLRDSGPRKKAHLRWQESLGLHCYILLVINSKLGS